MPLSLSIPLLSCLQLKPISSLLQNQKALGSWNRREELEGSERGEADRRAGSRWPCGAGRKAHQQIKGREGAAL